MGDGILLEKRSVIGLKGYFTRTLLVFLAGLVLIFASAFFLLVLGMQVGILLPANAGGNCGRGGNCAPEQAGALFG